MLQELFVKDFAIIDSLHLSFMHGLNILTGETGTGKSIIVGALNLLIGGRASGELIRTGKDEAIVEAVFDIKDNKDIQQLLLSLELQSHTDQVLIRRIISRTGKNKILINDHPATIQVLEQLGGRLIDISGQYSQQLLLQVDNHIDLLDSFGDHLKILEQYKLLYSEFLKKVHELKSLLAKEAERINRQEILEFQNLEITQAKLCSDEEQKLISEKKICGNAKKLYEIIYNAFANIYENENACLSLLNHTVKELQEATAIDPVLLPFKKNLESALLILEDTALSLRTYAQNINIDHCILENIEVRLDEIHRLKRKYGKSIEQILAYQISIQKELDLIEENTSRISETRQEIAIHFEKLWRLAEHLSSKRRKAASLFKKKVETELKAIGMKKASFFTEIKTPTKESLINFEEAIPRLNIYGIDTIEFYISPNQGEEPKPLSCIASGGEISRIVLAIKKLIAGNYKVSTLLFDEVDAGIGGAVAEAVGLKLKEIARSHQVLCITHLPQIACFGDYHYSVNKNISNGRTVTCVNLLNDQSKLDEIARMLGGKSVSEKTIAHALEMIKNAQQH